MLSVFEGGGKIPARFKALLKQSASSLRELWTECDEYVLAFGWSLKSLSIVSVSRLRGAGGGLGFQEHEIWRPLPIWNYWLLECKKSTGSRETVGCGMGRILCMATAKTCAKVTFLGIALTGTTAVHFNGTAATFAVGSSGTAITTTVPGGRDLGTCDGDDTDRHAH